MENLELGLGAGLMALAFWGFLAAIIVAGIIAGVWDGIRKKESQHETVRRLVDSGQPIDTDLLDKLLLLSDGGNKRHDRDFKLTGMWMLPIAPGLAVLGLVLGANEETADALGPLLGVALLIACMGIGFLVAARVVQKWYPAASASEFDQLKD